MMTLVSRMKRLIFRTGKKQGAEIDRLSGAVATSLSVGNTEGALERCGHLAQFLESLSGESHLPEVQNLLMVGYFNLGADYRAMQKVPEAEAAYAECIRICEAFQRNRSRSSAATRQLAACKNHLGLLYMDNKLPEKAAVALDEAITIRKALSDLEPDDSENQVYLGGAICNRAHLVQAQGKKEEAEKLYDQSIQILERAIPHCDCGCQNLLANMISQITSHQHWITVAHQFKFNAEQGKLRLTEAKAK